MTSKQKSFLCLIIIILLNLALVSCTFSPSQEFDQEVADAVIQTMEARMQETQQAQQEKDEFVSAIVSQVLTALPPQAEQAPPSASEAQPTKAPPSLSAVVIGENYPDGTVLNPGEAFTKRWTVRNTGTCTWTAGYTLRFMSGNSLSEPALINFPHSVPPGGSVELLVPMVAPSANGTFRGDWGLYSSSNVYFGKMWVSIKVTEGTTPPDAFSVISVSLSSDPADYDVSGCDGGVGNVGVPVSGKIKTNGQGLVEYTWVLSIAPTVWKETIYSAGPSNIPISNYYFLPATTTSKTYKIWVYIISPNELQSSALSVQVVCPGP